MENILKVASFFEVSTDYLLGNVGHPQVELIPADPEKAKVHEAWLNQQRDESFARMAEAMKKAAPDGERLADDDAMALIKDIQDLSEEEAAKTREYILFLKQQRMRQP